MAAAALLRSRWFRLSDVALAALAPRFAAVLATSPEADAPAVSARDASELDRARAAVSEWRAAADRLPASELIDLAIRSTGYAAELAGRRFEQARENLKKVRALLRRVESRGYANLARLSRFFETLHAGDESNAVVAAAEAVNLMTIHAAKGLEFPIVFVVNLQTPARGRSEGVTVTDRGPDDQPAVGIITADAAALEEAREAEEAKRLLYVAATRARDRLYFSAVLDRGRLPSRARSLASLLPASFARVFEDAVRADSHIVRWVSPEGAFDLSVCRATTAQAGGAPADRSLGTADLRPLACLPPPPVGVAAWAAGTDDVAAQAAPSAPRALVGTLVHRLFQHLRARPAARERVLALAWSLLTESDRAGDAQLEAIVEAAARAYDAVASDGELRALLGDGIAHFEVAVSFRIDAEGPLLRGTVDCLILHFDGRLTVVDVKTGRPRPDHARQVDLYAQAASLAFGVTDVGTKIVYVGG